MTIAVPSNQLLRKHAARPLEDERSWPVLSMGFRPFFLLATVFAAVDVLLWLLTLNGVLAPSSYLDPVSWHAHEMLFGLHALTLGSIGLLTMGMMARVSPFVSASWVLSGSLWTLEFCVFATEFFRIWMTPRL